MARKNMVIANWKMNPGTAEEAEKWLKNISKSLSNIKRTEIIVCAPFIYLARLKRLSRKVVLGAQDAFLGDVGPYTGEVSSDMLYNLGVRYVILGHSERRALGETNELISKKIKSALTSGLVPVVCIGERERDEGHKYFDVVQNQIRECFKGIAQSSFPKVVIVYEPVWSISSTLNRRDATASDAREMAVFIRKTLSDISSPEIASDIRIIYGGSVNEKDALGFIQDGGVSGLLVGKASMDPKKFVEIINICEASRN